MSNTVDPLDVLSFIDGYTNMPSEQWKRVFPEWAALMDKARKRFQEETENGRRGWARSSAMISSEDQAIHHWVFLPLIQAALAST